ncbi:bifunctional arginine demethylase and lysyl-hydroxylase JMJD6-like [Tubulanus polymorphus]|uniref:bifunctional arginine demethylase and lysyl-hydroxylase JMJD6-like n=1 Tax=Tubulanus polymorphus TaxID=672921 RepID=UPI003DA38282
MDPGRNTSSQYESPREAFEKVYRKAIELGLKPEHFENLDSVQFIKTRKSNKTFWIVVSIVIAILLSCTVAFKDWPVTSRSVVDFYFEYIKKYDNGIEREKCIFPVPDFAVDVFRPVKDCSVCEGMSEVDRVSNITPEEFEKKYAYSKRPVVITDGAKNWTAPKIFSFEYFKKLYKDQPTALAEHAEKSGCQFFPYKTEFEVLEDVFDMGEARALMTDGSKPWYIGWSNCDSKISAELRQHYDRPYFLPKLSESSKTDWIFMGSPGYGAHMHVDNVNLPSWQAQITGTKKWILEPPRECHYTCPSRVEVVIHPGEIIVLDTDTWYHATLVLGNEISIVIGSEYD